MKKWIKENKGLIVKLCFIVGLIVWFIVLNNLKKNMEFCEAYSRGFGRVLGTVLAFITNLFPISLAEVSIIISSIVVLILIILIFRDLKKLRPFRTISRVVTILLIPVAIITCYFTTSEMQYNRKEVPIPLYQGEVAKEEHYAIVEYFLNDYNECAKHLTFKKDGNVDIGDYTFDKLNTILAKEYEKLSKEEFGSYFNKFTPRCKPMMSSAIYTELQITGVDFGLFGEANVNTMQPAAGFPMVMAHEIAHTKGVMRERDANLVAMYVLLNSDDYFLRYSAYYWGFYSVLELARYTGNKEDYQTLSEQQCYEIQMCDYHSYKFWKDHDLLGKIGDWINNLYIKSSGDEEGTNSYNDTPVVVNPDKEIVISYSIWQKMYLNLYFNKKASSN